VILQTLVETDSHPNALELFDMVREKLPRVSLSTVYRTLESLEKRGELLKIRSTDKECRFDGRTEQHYHFICEECGRVFDFPSGFSPAVPVPEDEFGFEISGFSLDYTGRCCKCRRTGS
jgi:Fe2+ or Zn2+ uptake regulation protein